MDPFELAERSRPTRRDLGERTIVRHHVGGDSSLGRHLPPVDAERFEKDAVHRLRGFCVGVSPLAPSPFRFARVAGATLAPDALGARGGLRRITRQQDARRFLASHDSTAERGDIRGWKLSRGEVHEAGR